MNTLTRRGLLKAAGGVTAGAIAGLAPWIAKADPVWGELPGSVIAPPDNFGVLHIHLLGGVAPFESFYYRDATGLRTRGFDSHVSSLSWNMGCSDTPSGLELASGVFANDAKSKAIHLGPFAKPLWSRTDIRDRIRVIVQSHDLLPHEAAIPFALTGRRLGNVNQASLGAAIAHRYLARDEAAGDPARPAPYAYGLLADTAAGTDFLATQMSAVGTHPGAARPLVLKIGPSFAGLIDQLERPGMTEARDTLLDHYRAQYRDWLRKGGDVTRSNAFRDYDTTMATLLEAAGLSDFLSSIPQTIPSESQCARLTEGSFTGRPNPTKTALQAAVFLLTRPEETERARYVCVIDSGIEPRGGLPYDVHNLRHAEDTGSNLFNLFSNLANLINDPAAGTPDPAKLSLSNKLIVITTEFGRTPFRSILGFPASGSTGRDHWPQAYVNVLIGGPISTRGVAGSIVDASDLTGSADLGYSPADFHAAALLASGIDPFFHDNFAVGQLHGSLQDVSHEAAWGKLKSSLLGL